MRQQTDEPLIFAVGQRIRQLRLERGLSLREFGKHADVHPFHLMSIELGQLAATTKTLGAIARALDVTLADLFNMADDDLGAIAETMRRDPSTMKTVRAYATRLVVN